MHNAEVAAERLIQFEKDKASFAKLSPRRQKIAGQIAAGGFKTRTAFVQAEKLVPNAIDAVIYGIFHLPWVATKFAVETVADSAVYGLKQGVRLGGGTSRRALSLLGDGKRISSWRDKILAWEQKTVHTVDASWRVTKGGLSKAARKALHWGEYYIAIGLYRGTAWILNPRTPKGKPLFGNEKLNRVIGTAAAVAIFTAVAFELAKFEALVKIWHVQYARTGMQAVHAGKTPLYTELLKQAIFQPAVMVGITAMKFVALPLLAASRETFKRSLLAQGVAYKYNARLKEQQAKAPQADNKKKRRFEGIKKTVEHIVEKSSPEFYAARLKHYKPEKKPEKKIDTPPPAAPAPVEAAGTLGKTELAKPFENASKPCKTAEQQRLPANAAAARKPRPQKRVM